MSDPDREHPDQGFLARWSQRKHEAKQPDRDAPVLNPDIPSAPVADGEPEAEFDLASLPKLEDMTATTDITAFFRKGVPEHLRNAALRKSWALDPAIRNYVNPALEYAYDWNTPGGVPGSSEIEAGLDVARLVSQIMGGSESAVDARMPSVAAGNQPACPAAPPSEFNATDQSTPDLPTQAVRLDDQAGSMVQEPSNTEPGSGSNGEPVADSASYSPAAPQQSLRRHGSAKPTV